MRSKIFITLGLVLVLCVSIASSSSFEARSNQSTTQSGEKHLAVVTKQLPHGDGLVPVELRCEDAELTGPNSIRKMRCVVRNNTDKVISAVTLVISHDIEKGGEKSSHASFLTIETFIHPDLRAARNDNRVPPGGEIPVRDLPNSYDDDVVIRGITVWIDYVEFEGNTALGLNEAGARIVTDIRAGAAKYKDWLIKNYARKGASTNVVNSLLESPLAPEEMGIRNGDEEHGASIYQKFARDTYSAHGAEGLVKRLKLTSTSTNR